MSKNYIKLFQLNEAEVYAAEDMKQAIRYAHKQTGVPLDELVDPDYQAELTDKDLDTQIVNMADEGAPKRLMTYRHGLEEMILLGHEFPSLFCSSEW